MGGSSSKASVKVENDVTVVDRQTVNLLNQSMNQLITNNMIKQAATCSGGAFSLQDIVLEDLVSEGDINIGVNQKAKVLLNFSCVNASEIKDTVSASMINDMMAQLQSSSTQEAINKMAAAASTESNSGFGSLVSAPANSDTNTEMTNRYNALSEKTKNITNSISNSIVKNFSVDDVKNCISSVTAQQKVRVKGAKARGNINAVITQDSAVEAITSCLNQSGIASNVVNNALTKLGVQVKDEASQVSLSDISGTAAAIAKVSGLDDVVTSIFSGFTGIFTGILGMFTGNPMSLISSVIVILIIVVGGYFYLNSPAGQKIVDEGISHSRRRRGMRGGDSDEFNLIGGILGDLLQSATMSSL
jgi:hypothetical protein